MLRRALQILGIALASVVLTYIFLNLFLSVIEGDMWVAAIFVGAGLLLVAYRALHQPWLAYTGCAIALACFLFSVINNEFDQTYANHRCQALGCNGTYGLYTIKRLHPCGHQVWFVGMPMGRTLYPCL